MGRLARIRSQLGSAQVSRTFLKIHRYSDPWAISAFVIDVGKKWVLLARTADGGFFDGYAAVRVSDIRKVGRDKSFEGLFAQTRPEWPPTRLPHTERVDLDRTRSLLRDFPQPGALMGIESTKRSSATWIGVADQIVDDWFYLHEVKPNAHWHRRPRGYRIRKIVMLYSDSYYLRGLAAIAGDPPAYDATPA
ncbi:hypothetical protein [Microbacterium sp. NPDC057944]|uniref:hypothetical protein n=1 Tax=Microbacterium sp. NPDC057944 TaxID=3346286 RepID=UPI0036DD5423